MERVAAAVAGDAAIPVLPVADTLKRVTDGRADQTVEREGLGAAQTPQAASLGILVAALDAARARSWEPTDDAAALAAIGVAVHAVAGDPSNRKLTEWTDVDVLRGALRSRVAPMDELSDAGRCARSGRNRGRCASPGGWSTDAPGWPRLP